MILMINFVPRKDATDGSPPRYHRFCTIWDKLIISKLPSKTLLPEDRRTVRDPTQNRRTLIIKAHLIPLLAMKKETICKIYMLIMNMKNPLRWRHQYL